MRFPPFHEVNLPSGVFVLNEKVVIGSLGRDAADAVCTTLASRSLGYNSTEASTSPEVRFDDIQTTAWAGTLGRYGYSDTNGASNKEDGFEDLHFWL